MSGLIKGKQIADDSISLGKLVDNGGSFSLANPSDFQIVGTASGQNDIVSKKDLDNAISGLTGIGGSDLTVEDYNTGVTYSNIDKMIFRGNTVTVPGGTATGSLAVGGSQAGTVVIWIPAPTYLDNFNVSSNSINNVSTTSRNVADPSGTYDIGNWSAGSPYTTLNSSYSGSFTYTCTDFSVFQETGSTVEVNIYGADGTTPLETLSCNLDANNSSASVTGLDINVTDWGIDQDRYKADVTFSIDMKDILPNGGRFSVELIHNNPGDNPSTYTFRQDDIMYDDDTSDGNTSTAVISGSVGMSEGTPVHKYLSGVAYYDAGSSFDISVSGIDNINEITYPNGLLSLDFSTNSNITDSNNLNSSSLGGWTNVWNNNGSTYNNSHSIGSSNRTTPGVNATNVLDSSNTTSLTAKLHDWVSNVNTKGSGGYNWLILVKGGSPTRNNEPLVNESRRLKVKDLLTGTNVEVAFDSEMDITTGDYLVELQQIQGESDNGSTRLVFPRNDFSSWLPSVNSSTNYSSASGSSLTIPVISNEATRATSNESYTNHRWYVRSFETAGGSLQPNGIFGINSDFTEADLSSGEIKLFLSVNPSNGFENKWYDLSVGFTNNGPGCRSNSSGYSLDVNDQIAWNIGTNHNGSRAFLLVGIKNTSKDKKITNLSISDGSWS